MSGACSTSPATGPAAHHAAPSTATASATITSDPAHRGRNAEPLQRAHEGPQRQRDDEAQHEGQQQRPREVGRSEQREQREDGEPPADGAHLAHLRAGIFGRGSVGLRDHCASKRLTPA